MKALDRKLGRDLLEARGTLVAILLVIMVGIACYVGMASVYASLEQAQRDYYAQCRMADFWIDLKKMPASEAARVAALPGVTEAQPRIVFEATIDLDDVPRPLTGQVLSLREERGAALNGVVLRRGTWYSGDRLEEVIVNDAFARARNIHPGDRLRVILNERRQELVVVGTAISSEFVYLMPPGGLIPDPENYGVLYVKERLAEETLDFDGACNQLIGRLAPGVRERPDAVLARIEQMLEPYGVFAATPRARQISNQILSDELAELKTTAVVLPAVFLAVAVLVLNILMSRLAEHQRVTVGTLKALGYTNGELTVHYLKFGALIGLVGGGLGLLGGYALAHGTTVMYRVYFELPRLDNRIVPGVYAAGAIGSVVFAMLGTARGVRAVLALGPAEAMRPRPPVTAGAIWLERFARTWRRLGFRWRMVMRSTWRHRWRTAVGVFAAAMGSTLVFTTFYFMGSVDYLLEYQFDLVLRSDFDVTFRDDRDAGAVLEARRLPGVDHVEALFTVPCRFENGYRTKRSAIMGVAPDARLTVARTQDGRRVPVPPAGLLMSRRLARALDVGPGDEVTIVPVKGLRAAQRVPVARIVDGFLGMATYADARWLNRLVGETDAVSSVQLATRSGLDDRLALYRALKDLPAVQSVSDNALTKEKVVTSLLDALRYSIAALVGMAGIIFFGSILTTSLIAIAERRREIATLIVIGYEPAQVGGIFLRESMLINVTGALLGAPMGLATSVALIASTTRDAYRLPTITSPWTYVITIGLAIAFTLLAHGLVQRVINRMNWQEALNAKE